MHARQIKHKNREASGKKKIKFACKIWKIRVILLMESSAPPLYCINVTNITQISFWRYKFLNVCLISISTLSSKKKVNIFLADDVI